MTNELQIAPQIAASAWAMAWSLAAPVLLKYGVSIVSVFFIVAWTKEWIPAEPHTKKVIVPIIALLLGITARFVTIAGEVALGAPAPSLVWLYVLLECFRGAGVGITASLFQKWVGWRVEKWMKSKFKRS